MPPPISGLKCGRQTNIFARNPAGCESCSLEGILPYGRQPEEEGWQDTFGFRLEESMFVAQNLLAAFERVTDYWSPKVIGKVNDQLLKAAKIKGELVWHAHDQEDELFHIVKGSMRIELEDGVVELREGDFVTIPKGTRHNPVADEECWILLIESTSTRHTGDEVTPLTRSIEEQFS
jgi:mannose-6-phosphate isomerase-like protein (cupin superfamily)